jgi:ribosomal protein S18 acetylase RimI-like enzyme
LYSIAVAPQARKLGIARQLLDFAGRVAAQHRCSSIILEVCESNSGAMQLYISAGFTEYGEKPGYYEDGCTAKLYSKSIPFS